MKKTLMFTAALLLATVFMYGGGIVTNTNQSASWVRMPARNATLGIDATYYNPAGLTLLKDGIHLSLSNQSIFQNREVTNNYKDPIGTAYGLNQSLYKGEVKAPIFPSVYGVYKKSKLAISFGFNPVGGGGGATFEKGIPAFEMDIADLKPLLSGMGLTTTQYSADIYFKASSIFFGYQLGVSYQFTDIVSAFAGARYVTAKNTYEGHINDIMINPLYAGNPTADMISAPEFFTNPPISSPEYAARTANRDVDVVQKGSGITPIIGISLNFEGKLNIGLKYEHKTNLDLTTEINDNKTGGLFKQDSIIPNEMPSMISAGIRYKPISKLALDLSINYYLDKAANYGKTLNKEYVKNDSVMDKNFIEFAIGAEYEVTEKLILSAGYLRAQTGVMEKYHSDQSHSLTSNTIGGGLGYRVNEKLLINLGFAYTSYQEGEKNYSRLLGFNSIPVKETYNRNTMIIAVGLDYSF